VGGEFVLSSKTTPTALAGERFHSGMYTFVPDEIGYIRKSLLADVTCIRLLTGMRSSMLVKIARVIKFLSTKIARQWTLPLLRPHNTFADLRTIDVHKHFVPNISSRIDFAFIPNVNSRTGFSCLRIPLEYRGINVACILYLKTLVNWGPS